MVLAGAALLARNGDKRYQLAPGCPAVAGVKSGGMVATWRPSSPVAGPHRARRFDMTPELRSTPHLDETPGGGGGRHRGGVRRGAPGPPGPAALIGRPSSAPPPNSTKQGAGGGGGSKL